MKKPKIFNEWFDMVFPTSEQGEVDAVDEWGEEEYDKCSEFLGKLFKIEEVGEEEE